MQLLDILQPIASSNYISRNHEFAYYVNLKQLSARFPSTWQQHIKCFHYRLQMRRCRFLTDEPEFKIPDSGVSGGDRVVDIGANVGVYTKRFSEIVGPKGRAIAFEPVPETFVFLTSNLLSLPLRNITLLNVALSDEPQLVGMVVPNYDNGLKNYFRATLTANSSGIQAMAMPLSALSFPHLIKLVKFDVEGPEYRVLQGMVGLLRRDHPILIVETNSDVVFSYLRELGYKREKLQNSPNVIFR